ncbi:Protein phosphatase 2C [Prevotella communis]|uniref:Protein phosphatase 2C n=1 Tax=Prevotella communis TaxID=2913614 RepID=A0A1G8B0K7_9BACT|nr:protein phosphatase 2C domain-containing protein [Prevotella communis]SDH26727.1 Protein phosphatase 2C [Prevotella communis]
MNMKVLYSFNQKGDGIANEDICGFTKDAAWVIDGATDVFNLNALGKNNEVNWYVNELHKLLYRNFTSEKIKIVDGIQKSVKELYLRLKSIPNLSEVPTYKLPTYTIAAIGIGNNIMDYYVLGDSSIAYLHDKEVHLLTDTRVSKFSIINRQKLKDFRINYDDMVPPLSLFQETRMKANAKDGYPIGTIDGEGLSFGISGTIYLSKGDKILLYTDGFKDYFKKNEGVIKKFFTENAIKEEIAKMYEFLKNPEEYKKNPRPKMIDDASLLLISI